MLVIRAVLNGVLGGFYALTLLLAVSLLSKGVSTQEGLAEHFGAMVEPHLAAAATAAVESEGPKRISARKRTPKEGPAGN